MTDKQFKIHSIIQGMDIGETMDLEVCEELIKKYGSSSDIDLLITNNGNDMTYQEVVDLLNENEQLKRSVQYWYDEHKRIVNNYVDKIKEVEKENEQLKQFKEKVFTCIDKEIARNEEAIEWGKETGVDSNSIGYYNQMLNRLKKELSE